MDREPRTSCRCCSQSSLQTALEEISLTGDKGATTQTFHFIRSLLGKMVRALLVAAFLMINPTCTEAIGDMTICYILDGILILYGIILTVLYCRLRLSPDSKTPVNQPEKQPAEGGIYAGLTCHSTDTYETIKMDKKPIV